MIKKFIHWLCTKLGYVPETQYRIVQENLSELTIAHNKYEHEMENQLNDFRERVTAMEFVTMEELKNENEALKLNQDKIAAQLLQAENFYKDVQTQITDMMHVSPIMGFPAAMRFPGASTITDHKIKNPGNEDHILVTGRTIFTDDVTAKIQAAHSMTDKLLIIRTELIKQGLVDKIAKNLINSGAFVITIGYNKDCTTCEAYYMLKAIIPETDLIINYDYFK